MKILALDKISPSATPEKITPLLKEETQPAYQLYKEGVFREMYFRQDRPGAVLILECANIAEAHEVLADLPLSRDAEGKPLRYGDLPGVDSTYCRGWAKTLSQVDPDAAQYHAEGRLDEYVEKVDLEGALQQVTCPVLLLQGDQSRGGIVSDEDVEHTLGLLADGLHVRLDGKGHNLGLGTWEVTPLLRAIINFLESL